MTFVRSFWRCYNPSWMFVAPQHLKKYSHRALAGFLAIWLSGLALLVACNAKSTSAMDNCPLAKLGAHCDKADKNKDLKAFSRPSSETGADCCAFIPAFFDKTRTFDGKQQIAPVALKPAVEVPTASWVRPTVAHTFSYRSTVLLKNHTFLKNRTFRI